VNVTASPATSAAPDNTVVDPFAVEQCKFIVAGLQKRLLKVREEDRRWHADPTIDEHPDAQYNRTVQIGEIVSETSAIDCEADPYSTNAVEIDQALDVIEKRMATKPTGKAETITSEDADSAVAKKSLNIGTLIAIVILSLLLLVAGVFIAYRRVHHGGDGIPTVATLSNLAISDRGVDNAAYNLGGNNSATTVVSGATNPMYGTANDGGGGFERGGKCATLPRSKINPAFQESQGTAGVSNALYAIPFETEGGGAVVTCENAEQFVVADGGGVDQTLTFSTGSSTEYLEVGSGITL